MASYFASPRRGLLVQRKIQRCDRIRFVLPALFLLDDGGVPSRGCINFCGEPVDGEQPLVRKMRHVSSNADSLFIVQFFLALGVSVATGHSQTREQEGAMYGLISPTSTKALQSGK